MIICDTLSVTPEWILSGSSKTGKRGKELSWYVIDKSTELGMLVTRYRELDEKQRAKGRLSRCSRIKILTFTRSKYSRINRGT